MAIPSLEEYRATKHPNYNAKTTIAVTERVLCNWCNRSNAYLWNVENALKRAIQIEDEFSRTGKIDGKASFLNRFHTFPSQAGYPLEVVAYDNLEYGLEMTLKAAQMVDGYHEFNRDVDIPGFIENFETSGGIKYVYVKPTHRLDKIYNKYLSDTMKETLREFFPMKEYLDYIYKTLHPETMNLTWVAGSDHPSSAGRVRYNSKRYTSDWITVSLDSNYIFGMLEPLRRLNGAIPLWLCDRDLKARPA